MTRTTSQINSGEPTNVSPMYSRGKAKVPGRGTGDKIPALLTPGEAVLTKRAAVAMGRDKISALNKSSAGPAERPRHGEGKGQIGPVRGSMSGLEAAMHAHADREHPAHVGPGRMR